MKIQPTSSTQLMGQSVCVRLPSDLDRVWREVTAADRTMFTRWAIASMALRCGWVKPADLESLPYLSADGSDFEMLPIGQVPPGFVEGWL
jgi:hypothetical protein